MKTKLLLIFLFVAAAIKSQPSEFTLIDSGSEKIFSFTEDGNGIIWAGAWGEIIKIQGDQIESFSIPTNYPIYSLDCDVQNNLWIATQDTGLIKFDGINWIYFNIREIIIRTPQYNNANCVRVDDNNNVWIGSIGGLARYDGENWVVYDDLNSPLQFRPDIFSIIADDENNIWFASFYGAGKFDQIQNWQFWDNLLYLSTSDIESDGTVWFVDQSGTNALKINEDSTWITTEVSCNPSSVYQFAIDSFNVKWFSNFGGGEKIFVYDDQDFVELVFPSYPEIQNSGVSAVYIDSRNNKWFGFDNGYIVKYTSDFPSYIEEENDIIVTDFKLYQNYPNPFNPTTKIKFTIPISPFNPSPYQGEGNRERFITLKVYDVLGNEVATLVNEEKPAGSYEVEFNGKGLPSGIYYYQIKAGSFIQTKKMILIK